MKKLISLILVFGLLLCCLPPCFAAAEGDAIAIRLNSDVAGCTREDVDRLIELLSPQVTWYENGQGNGPVSIANAAGGGEYAHMEAGREYTVTYMLQAAEGYTLPEEIGEGDVSFACGKGVSVIYCKIAEMHNPATPDKYDRIRALRIMATVVPDGTALQRIIGWVRDLILKIRSWQLY